MRVSRRIVQIMFLTASVALSSQAMNAQDAPLAETIRVAAAATVTQGAAESQQLNAAELLEDSREAGLLTDWHLDGCFGHDGARDFARQFSPEHAALKLARRTSSHYNWRRYDLEFADGIFVLAPQEAGSKGVFYADSSTYLNDGEWNVYLESAAEAVVFVDGKRVVERGAQAKGVVRATIHASSGYHSVLVKFVAAAAPFRVAILPPNSGSRRKNNTPYLKAAPASEDMMAQAQPGGWIAGN